MLQSKYNLNYKRYLVSRMCISRLAAHTYSFLLAVSLLCQLPAILDNYWSHFSYKLDNLYSHYMIHNLI